MRASARTFLKAAAAVLMLSSCYGPKEWTPSEPREPMPPVTTQTATEKPYGTTRLVRAPVNQPSAEPAEIAAERVFPMAHLNLKNSTLKVAASQLGKATGYHSYCASSIADKKVTFSSLGTIDELAAGLAETAGIQVIVDHSSKEVRFLNAEVMPSYGTEGVLRDESQ